MSLTAWRHVPIEENGEPLVRLTGLYSQSWHRTMGRPGSLDEIWMRVNTNRNLFKAQSYLPQGIKLLVLDGWRPVALHQKIVTADLLEIAAHPELKEILDPADITAKHPAPSLTGGRVGITLCDDQGEPLDMGSVVRHPCLEALTYYYHDKHSEQAELFHKRRMCLLAAMTRSGFSSDGGAWWRFQHGTQHHHSLVGGPAQYGLVTHLPGDHEARAFS